MNCCMFWTTPQRANQARGLHLRINLRTVTFAFYLHADMIYGLESYVRGWWQGQTVRLFNCDNEVVRVCSACWQRASPYHNQYYLVDKEKVVCFTLLFANCTLWITCDFFHCTKSAIMLSSQAQCIFYLKKSSIIVLFITSFGIWNTKYKRLIYELNFTLQKLNRQNSSR